MVRVTVMAVLVAVVAAAAVVVVISLVGTRVVSRPLRVAMHHHRHSCEEAAP